MSTDLADIISMARYRLRDFNYPYRWNDEVMIRYLNDGIKELRRIRPDTRIGSDGISLVEYEEVPMVNPWIYTETGDINQICSGYEGIVGWDKHTFPTLYFNVDSSTVTSVYASSSDRSYSRFRLFYISGCDTVGSKSITMDKYKGSPSGFGGVIKIDNIAVPNSQFTVTAEGVNLIIPEEIFNDMLANYVASECLKMEWDDTQNTTKAKQFEQEFYDGITRV